MLLTPGSYLLIGRGMHKGQAEPDSNGQEPRTDDAGGHTVNKHRTSFHPIRVAVQVSLALLPHTDQQQMSKWKLIDKIPLLCPGAKHEVVQQTHLTDRNYKSRCPSLIGNAPRMQCTRRESPRYLILHRRLCHQRPSSRPLHTLSRHRQPTMPSTLETQNQTGAIAQRSILRGSSMYSLTLIRNCTASLPSSRRWS